MTMNVLKKYNLLIKKGRKEINEKRMLGRKAR
jgi:hypothetical protein